MGSPAGCPAAAAQVGGEVVGVAFSPVRGVGGVPL